MFPIYSLYNFVQVNYFRIIYFCYFVQNEKMKNSQITVTHLNFDCTSTGFHVAYLVNG